jgi:hypothetical protein
VRHFDAEAEGIPSISKKLREAYEYFWKKYRRLVVYLSKKNRLCYKILISELNFYESVSFASLQ